MLSLTSLISAQDGQDLSNMGLEDLMRLEVTTASRMARSLADTAAAVYVITQEDIQRSAATNVPDVLRMAPGVQVGQIDANKWMISIRGFNSRFANKLLVLIDGRSVYTPLFSGVYWDFLNIPLEEIERIEVIRGPGGALWGANAVNGVINIITKRASATLGNQLSVLAGSEERFDGYVRHGGEAGAGSFYRAYVRHFVRDSQPLEDGTSARDGWEATQAGARIDWEDRQGVDSATLQVGLHTARMGQTSRFFTPAPPFAVTRQDRFPVSSWFVVGRWERQLAADSGLSLQLNFDGYDRQVPETLERRFNFGADFQHRLAVGNHTINWGLEYRQTHDRTVPSEAVTFDPASTTDRLWAAFLQDDIQLNRRTRLAVGAKLEHNDYSGYEFQPSLRILHAPSEDRSIWASVSRAVRSPARNDHHADVIYGVTFNNGMPVMLRVDGDPGFRSESVLAYEAGHRWQPSDRLYLDAAVFYNVYRNLRTFEPGQPFFGAVNGVPTLIQPFSYGNKMRGETAGFELSGRWRLNESLDIHFSYTLFDQRLRLDADSMDPFGESYGDGRGANPRHQFQIRPHLDLTDRLKLDMGLFYTDALRGESVPASWRVDARLAYQATPDIELMIGAQNLFGGRRFEVGRSQLLTLPSQIGPSFFIRGVWRF
jgi:iron complex outermembrane recepter protein